VLILAVLAVISIAALTLWFERMRIALDGDVNTPALRAGDWK
jgi:hypothetical protein